MERIGMGLDDAAFATSLYFIFRTAGCFLGSFILRKMSPKSFLLHQNLRGGSVRTYVNADMTHDTNKTKQDKRFTKQGDAGSFILRKMSPKSFFGISVVLMLIAMIGLFIFHEKAIIYACIALLVSVTPMCFPLSSRRHCSICRVRKTKFPA